MNSFSTALEPCQANFEPLTPVSFLKRAAQLRPDAIAIIDDTRQFTYREFWSRSQQLARALHQRGFTTGDCIAAMCGNTVEMLEAHNGIPLLGGVLNSLNIRLDAPTIAHILTHGQARVILVDQEFSVVIREALSQVDHELLVIDIPNHHHADNPLIGACLYDDLLQEADAATQLPTLTDEWQALSLLYTSGTTGNPKGCVYHHRGAYLNAIGNMTTLGLNHQSRYLWTLPMFHCDGWTFTWAVTASMGTHVCLRKIDPALIFKLIQEHQITHMCGAPIVLNMLANASDQMSAPLSQTVEIATGGAAPPCAVIEAMEALGFHVIHLYGLTETYGPATVCLPQDDWPDLSLKERSGRMARQGVHYLTLGDATIMDPKTMTVVPADGKTIGELMIRGNTVMKGYLKNEQATQEAFAGGWFHTGDLGVLHADGYIEVKDRAKDIIISGGENISTLEVEEALYRHPDILEAAVVAMPDKTWGETPCAFVTLKPARDTTAANIIEHCRGSLAHFKVPRHVVFGPLPKTSTGKIQKFDLRERAKALSGEKQG